MNKSEVEQLASVESIPPGEVEVKNCFLFWCYTGIRFSDILYRDITNLDEGVAVILYSKDLQESPKTFKS